MYLITYKGYSRQAKTVDDVTKEVVRFIKENSAELTNISVYQLTKMNLSIVANLSPEINADLISQYGDDSVKIDYEAQLPPGIVSIDIENVKVCSRD